MDTLISVGMAAAYLWLLYALFFSAAGRTGMRMGFAWLARSSGAGATYLEVACGVYGARPARPLSRGPGQAPVRASLRALLSLAAKDVAVLRDGTEARVPVEEMSAGESFVVRPGEKIAADGVVISSSGSVNADGRLVVRATRVGADTQLARMARRW